MESIVDVVVPDATVVVKGAVADSVIVGDVADAVAVGDVDTDGVVDFGVSYAIVVGGEVADAATVVFGVVVVVGVASISSDLMTELMYASCRRDTATVPPIPLTRTS